MLVIVISLLMVSKKCSNNIQKNKIINKNPLIYDLLITEILLELSQNVELCSEFYIAFYLV